MKRRDFIGTLTVGGTATLSTPISGLGENLNPEAAIRNQNFEELLEADAVDIGAGLGGFAATISLLRNNKILIQ